MNQFLHIKHLMMLVLLAMLSSAATATEFTTGGLRYVVNDDGSTVTVYTSNDNLSGALTIPASVTSDGTTYAVTAIGRAGFSQCSNLTSVTIPNSVTTIGENAFYRCTGLTSVNIPNSVTTIGYDAFCKCTGLTSVTIPESASVIGSSAFEYCSGLTEVTIPNSVRHLEGATFEGCTSMRKLVLGTGLQAIEGTCFASCPSLREIHAKSIKPPFCYDDGLVFEMRDSYGETDYANFFLVYDNATLYVPMGCLAAYENAGDWGLFSDIREESMADGDINDDGMIDVTDVDMSIDMVLGKKPMNLYKADLDGNGVIDVTDVSMMIDKVLGK